MATKARITAFCTGLLDLRCIQVIDVMPVGSNVRMAQQAIVLKCRFDLVPWSWQAHDFVVHGAMAHQTCLLDACHFA